MSKTERSEKYQIIRSLNGKNNVYSYKQLFINQAMCDCFSFSVRLSDFSDSFFFFVTGHCAV